MPPKGMMYTNKSLNSPYLMIFKSENSHGPLMMNKCLC